MSENYNVIEIERDGVKYSGSYTVSKKMVTVRYGDKQTTTQIGGSPAESIARMILSELIQK